MFLFLSSNLPNMLFSRVENQTYIKWPNVVFQRNTQLHEHKEKAVVRYVFHKTWTHKAKEKREGRRKEGWIGCCLRLARNHLGLSWCSVPKMQTFIFANAGNVALWLLAWGSVVAWERDLFLEFCFGVGCERRERVEREVKTSTLTLIRCFCRYFFLVSFLHSSILW